jgi:XTP/dITP diphosphohydrolase
MNDIELWIATSNPGKLGEFRNLLQGHIISKGWKIKTPRDLPVYSAPPENGDSFLANARIKAKSVKSVVNSGWVIAEDSGLVVEGLGGLPGIHTARYAGPKANDIENMAKLIKMMQLRAMETRAAKFLCCAVVYSPTGEEMVFEGELKGEIARASKGAGGFGYDPVFIPEGQPAGETKTLAELPPLFKSQHSHRAQALRAFLTKIDSL